MEGEEKPTLRLPGTAEPAHRGAEPQVEIAFEEPTPPFVGRQPEHTVEPDRAPESIFTDLPGSAHLPGTSLLPVDLRALGRIPAGVGAAEVGSARHAPARRARRSGSSRALYAGCVACGILVAGGVAFGLARARALRVADAQAATVGHSTLSTGGAASLPSAPPESASSPVESSSGTPGEALGGSHAADTPAPAPPAPTAAGAGTGTLVLSRHARPGSVWLDGIKITAASTSVACGKHELRVKGWHKHPIRVPCGGEFRVTR